MNWWNDLKVFCKDELVRREVWGWLVAFALGAAAWYVLPEPAPKQTTTFTWAEAWVNVTQTAGEHPLLTMLVLMLIFMFGAVVSVMVKMLCGWRGR